MNLTFSAEQAALRDAVAALYSKESTPERVRAAEPQGFDPDLWRAVTLMELPTMGVPEAAGGGGATVTDLAVAAEQHGAHAGSVPLVETMVAARLLARSAAGGALAPVLGGAPAALALRPARDGVARLVPGGSVAAAVVALRGDDLVVASPPEPPPRKRTLHSGAVADVPLEAATTVLSGPPARTAFDMARREWRVLQAAALTGLAATSLALAVQYAKDRHQFGVPLGTFQALQHRLADLRARTDGAQLLAYEAAWAADVEVPDADTLAAQALWFCGGTATDTADDSLHLHGGYGFMLEYDIQLYARRARGWRLVAGDPREDLQSVARRRWPAGAPAADDPPPPGARPPARDGMDFRLDDESLSLQEDVRALLDRHLTQEVTERALTTGTMHDWDLHRALCERGYLAAGWPVEVGGLGHSAVATTTLLQELYRSGAPVDGMGIAAMVGATLLLRGNDHHRQDVLPRILAGDVLCCLGYSEPDAGSDVAAVRTRAVRDGDEWVINGQKMFTTMAHEAEYVFLLTRTDTGPATGTESPDGTAAADPATAGVRPRRSRSRGLTMFLVPMQTPGIEVTPVETLGGERTNITFYSDVRVPDTCRVGDIDDGWSVMHAALVYERNGANWGEPAHLLAEVARWAATPGPDGARLLDDPAVQERLARWDTWLEVGRLLLYRSAWMAATGALPQVEGSMAKLVLTETFARAAADLLELCGPEGLLDRTEEGSVLGGLVEHASRHAVVTTIYGGSSEIQREIIAQRGLGLPRTR